MKIVTFYQINRFDGGDRHIPSDICFSNMEEADKFVSKNKYDDYVKRQFFVYESSEEYIESNSKILKEKALAKLTDLEKKALGLL
jgi:hypothetical protein